MIIDSPSLLFKNSPCEMVHKKNIIYKMVNITNGKIYIGKTTRELRDRIHEHIYSNKTYPIEKAVKKYGIEKFDIEVIAEADNDAELNELEKFFINFYNSKKPNGYNLTDGAEGCKGLVFTQEHRDKIAAKARKRRHTDETKKKISEHKKGQGKGRPIPELTRKKSIEARSRPVRCIETGQTFPSISAAARWLGVKDDAVGRVCRGQGKTSKGYHWEFVTDKD